MLFARRLGVCLSFSLMVGTFVSMGAFGANTKNLLGENFKQAWNVSQFESIKSDVRGAFEHSLKTGCVGDSLAGCEVWTNGTVGNLSSNYGNGAENLKDEGTILMLIARTVSTRGAEFCVTQIQISNEDRIRSKCSYERPAKAWTEYYYPTGAESNCFWLCKKGYFGEACEYTNPENCASLDVKQKTFGDYQRVRTGGKNIEDNLPMFYMNEFIVGGDVALGSGWEDFKDDIGLLTASNNGYEYDTVLGVTRFISSGNGAFVAPITIRSGIFIDDMESGNQNCNGIPSREKNYRTMNIYSTPYLKISGEETLVCKDGFVPNETNTDCVGSELCSIRETELKFNQASPCETKFANFDEKEHIKYLSNDGSCYRYKCKEPKGFASSNDVTCVECSGKPGRFGLSASGVCVTCPTGTVFDIKSSNSCRNTKSISMQDLKGSDNKDCWRKTDNDEYKECILGSK